MSDAVTAVPAPRNEPVHDYAPGSTRRDSLKSELARMMTAGVEIPLRIGGRSIYPGRCIDIRPPHERAHRLGVHHSSGPAEIARAIETARDAHRHWSGLDWPARAAIFLKAADLLSGPYRDRINAATMLGQSKTVYQAEIDAACEMADFWRFNVHYMRRLYKEQPESPAGSWNRLDYRPLEGFVFAPTPFNFTSIGGNLPTAPALMGNTVLWKPAETATLSAWVIMEVLEAAGLPPGVINFLPGSGAEIGDPVLASPQLAGVHFTGSTATFRRIWQTIGARIDRYRSYPRIVGETGGKDFVFAHSSAELDALLTALVRGAFEYQGQKCSAASRAFIPAGLWDAVVGGLEERIDAIRIGSPLDFRNFMCAVIDAPAYRKITSYIDYARGSDDHQVLIGGQADDSDGYFIHPTVVEAARPDSRLMTEEIFGPVLTLYRYPENRLDETIDACDRASSYALTGALFCQERTEIERIGERLRYAAGNFYINDKPTGAVVGQQPFGGGRASGTNDKAGSPLNLMRWVSPRAIKETFVPPTDFRYPHMAGD